MPPGSGVKADDGGLSDVLCCVRERRKSTWKMHYDSVCLFLYLKEGSRQVRFTPTTTGRIYWKNSSRIVRRKEDEQGKERCGR